MTGFLAFIGMAVLLTALSFAFTAWLTRGAPSADVRAQTGCGTVGGQPTEED